MEYGLLLVSEMQGIGKTTLCSRILAPLVGLPNVSYPNEDAIVNSTFNSWLAHKRLIVVGEIYSGHSWKAYNKLKSYVTDREVEVNQKFMRPYTIQNWAHIVASSNSRKALKMEAEDRRWFYPTITENPWPREKFAEFNNWISSGGLSIIKHWADTYGEYVEVGARAPMTNAKKEIIEGSRSEAAQAWLDACEVAVSEGEAVAFSVKTVQNWLKANFGKVYESGHDLKKLASGFGFRTFPKRIKLNGTMDYVIVSPKLQEALGRPLEAVAGEGLPEDLSAIKAALRPPVAQREASF
jgi:hypothetical protein